MTGYQEPGWFTKHVFNPIVEFATRRGLSMAGSRVLEVQGRKSGKWFSTPVNPLSFEGQRYLVAPRGETQWVRNIRVSGEGRLKRGGRAEVISVVEVPDAEKVPILRAYLAKWAWETKAFFRIASKNPSDEEMIRIAPAHPVFRVEA